MIISTLTGRLGDLAVALIVAVVAVLLALRRFYSEKWWEKKADAYTDIIEALSHIAYSLDRDYGHYFEGQPLSDGEAKVLGERFRAARQEIERKARAGVFLISRPVVDELLRLVVELDRQHPEGNWQDDIARQSVAADKALGQITELAKADLQVSSSWFTILGAWTRRLHPHRDGAFAGPRQPRP